MFRKKDRLDAGQLYDVGVSGMNTPQQVNDGYMIPDVHQDGGGISEMNTSQQPNDGYNVPEAYEGSKRYEGMDTYSIDDIKYYYPDKDQDDHSIYDEPEAGFGLWIWHLIKDDKIMHNTSCDENTVDDKVKDIVRPYLPATGSVIKKYVRDLFDAFMNQSETHFPKIVKDIFDFFDKKAMDRQEPELAKTWKTNVLFRGIYSTLLRKPSLIYDVQEYSYVQACLDVVALTLKNICADENERHDDPSSSQDLYSQLVPIYQVKLDQYYTQIKKMKKAQHETLETEYTKLQKDFAGTLDLTSVQFRLYMLLKDHINQLMSKEFSAEINLIGKLKFIQTAVGEIEERSTTTNTLPQKE